VGVRNPVIQAFVPGPVRDLFNNRPAGQKSRANTLLQGETLQTLQSSGFAKIFILPEIQ
jgi:hypothetical protein